MFLSSVKSSWGLVVSVLFTGELSCIQNAAGGNAESASRSGLLSDSPLKSCSGGGM